MRPFLATPSPDDPPRVPFSPEQLFALEAGRDPDGVYAEAEPLLEPADYRPDEHPEAALRRRAGLPEPD